jgi:hypothetical protein
MCKKPVFLLFFVVLMFASCSKHKDVNVSHIELDVRVKRFDRDFFENRNDSLHVFTAMMNTKYPLFFELYNNMIAGLGSSNTSAYYWQYQDFINHRTTELTVKAVNDVFNQATVDRLNKQLTDAFKHVLYYFPKYTVPEVIMFVSGFRTDFIQRMVMDSAILAIEMDKYLGRNHEIYQRLGVYRYLMKNCYVEKIPSDCMYAVAMAGYPFNDQPGYLKHHMVHQGKLYYYVRQMIPEAHDTVVFGYTTDELEFCFHNEQAVWTYLIEHELLHKTDRQTIMRYMEEAPYTKDFRQSSPGKLLHWMGARIVDSYMQKNELSLNELMNEKDYDKIIRLSRYDP